MFLVALSEYDQVLVEAGNEVRNNVDPACTANANCLPRGLIPFILLKLPVRVRNCVCRGPSLL